MPLKLMYITNCPDVARIAQAAGVDRIFVDMEYMGKSSRQGGMDTVQNHHTVQDAAAIRRVVSTAELLVRCNPIHEQTKHHAGSRNEIEQIIAAGADIVMLPFFRSVDEVRTFLSLVGGRVRTCLLFETAEAVEAADEILALPGIDEVLIGLNDLGIAYHRKFMFELLADGTVEALCRKFRKQEITYGFGGIASLGKGLLPSEYIIKEHYRLGSTCTILSRSFCNVNRITDMDNIAEVFHHGIYQIRQLERECEAGSHDFRKNREELCTIVKGIVESDRNGVGRKP